MIFIGDIASPNAYTSECFSRMLHANRNIFSNKPFVCNLEGLICDAAQTDLKEPVLYNHSSIINIIKQERNAVFCLANNHILDLPDCFDTTSRLLSSERTYYCGAGKNKTVAEKPAIVCNKDYSVAIFNVCWDFLLYNHKNPRSGIHVATLRENKLLKTIRDYKHTSPESYVVVYIHWSFDLETLPFPMSRIFSKDLIDAGTNVVIGAHSHCIQGGERYKNGYIVYSLGNFFIPHNYFINGKLVYPAMADVELAFEWDPISNYAICHWFKYQYNEGQHDVIHLKSEDFNDSLMLKRYSPYEGMTNAEYLSYYKRNRRKKIFIPVYKDYNKKFKNRFLTFLLKIRAGFARLLAKHGFRKWLN